MEDFGFAFNDSSFSDILLRIEILSHSPVAASQPSSPKRITLDKSPEYLPQGTSSTMVGYGLNDAKKKSNDESSEKLHQGTSSIAVGCGLNNAKRKSDDGSPGTSTTEISQTSCKRPREDGNASNDDGDRLTPGTIFSIWVNSLVLGVRSEYFYKLFKQTKEKEVTIRIRQSEEESMKAIIMFMYDDQTLSWTTADEVLQILMLSDRFCVPLCVKKCIDMLCDNPMTVDYALEYLRLPSHLKADLELLINAAKNFLQIHFRDIIGLEEEVLRLPLFALKELLSSNKLSVDDEDTLFDLIVKWAEVNCNEMTREKTIQNHLLRHIRFPYMSEAKLKTLMTSKFLDPLYATRVVMEARLFKSGIDNTVFTLRKEQFAERVYKYKSLNVSERKTPRKEVSVFLKLRRDECTKLFPNRCLCSQVFYFDGIGFFLRVESCQDPQTQAHSFGLGVSMLSSTPTQSMVDVKFYTMSKPSFDYECNHSFGNIFTGDKIFVGTTNLLWCTWDSFIGVDSVYFFDEIFYIMVELKAVNPV